VGLGLLGRLAPARGRRQRTVANLLSLATS